ncbi:MAG TPA: CpsB/CapC family capsule biosynthesis tyrosine phosphatase [Gaiellaceae bacterium]|nr:CpsB/CapC family capsule biosynthesis tyrosine phosphatase [Gaiellaceae bacterium]
MRPRFVDCHSHVCPSGDDGAASVAEGAVLCRDAARHGTGILFATPHVWPHLPLTEAREERIRRAHAELAAKAGLELRLGFELTPHRALLDEDLRRYALGGTDRVLVEVPFWTGFDELLLVATHAVDCGLVPVIAHPERSEDVLARPQLVDDLLEQGWPLQVNGSSLLGRHGLATRELAFALVDDGRASLVASDGHRQARPPHLDDAYELVVGRVGESAATRLFDGSALGLDAEPAAA